MAFPDDRDRELMRQAALVRDAADDLMDWMSRFKLARQEHDLMPIAPIDEFQLLSLRRTAGNLLRSSRVPVAAAAYGASQVGKSLFVGRVLRPSDPQFCPLGRDENLGPPSYYPNLRFDDDLNPQCGDNEATALVTRFTTKDRFDETVPTRFPVLVRGLTRAEWLRVLARGFRSERDFPPDDIWQEQQLEELFAKFATSHGATDADRDWRMDLLDVYSYVRRLDPLRYRVDESLLNGLISRYPLTADGYVGLAARILWNSDARLTSLYHRTWKFLELTRQKGRDGIACHWAAVRFLLDSQLKPTHQSLFSQAFPREVHFTDLVDRFEDGWYVLDYQPGQGPPQQDQATIQAAMLEMVVPVLPDRLNAEWRHVLEQIDFLDIPGMRNQGKGSEQSALPVAQKTEELLEKEDREIVKRGKVFYLFERYIEEMQIQTLLLLVRSGNLDVKGLLKESVDKWGRIRYGKEAWPHKVQDDPPALFIGMTGIDLEFTNRPPNSDIYNARLNVIVMETFKEIMTDFGGKGRRFTNIYPIRYPGSWDLDEKKRAPSAAAQRAELGKDHWQMAGEAFLNSPMVGQFVAEAELKWEAAMRDGDGGASLIAAAFRKCTSAIRKQDQLFKAIGEIRTSLTALADSWVVDPNANMDRDRRLAAAEKVMAWCQADEQLVYARVNALREALCFRPGDVMYVADLADVNQSTRQRPEPLERRLKRELPGFLMEWGKLIAPERWKEHTAGHEDAGRWLEPEAVGTFARYLAEYLCSGPVLEALSTQLLSVIAIQNRDEIARRNARRKFTRLILNDFVMTPGPQPSAAPTNGNRDGQNNSAAEDAERDFGLMAPFVHRWKGHMPEALASAAGANVRIPPGNAELHEWLNEYRGQFAST